MRRFFTVVSFLFFAIMATDAFGANWYVDKSATGANSGSSWTNAWTSLAGINWASVAPGDTVYISGGTTSKTYSGMTVGKSGTSTSPIYIKPGSASSSPAGHDGQVIISGSSISLDKKSYVTIDGEKNGTRNFRITGGRIDGYGTIGIKIKYIELDNADGGVYLPYSSKAEIAYNYIHHIRNAGTTGCVVISNDVGKPFDDSLVHHNILMPIVDSRGGGFGADGVRGSVGISVYNNIIEGIPAGIYSSGQHPDGVQALGSNWKVYNNTVKNMNNAGIFITCLSTCSGFEVYNNAISLSISSSGPTRALQVKQATGTASLSNIKIYNNTITDFYGYPGIRFTFTSTSQKLFNVKIMNNLVYNSLNAIQIDNASYACGTDVLIDYNLRHAGSKGTNYIKCNGATYTQAHDRTAQPVFRKYTSRGADNDLHLSASDTAARNQGFDLSTSFKVDRDGVTRPQAAAWDIGAYEYTDAGYNGGGLTSPAPPMNLTVE